MQRDSRYKWYIADIVVFLALNILIVSSFNVPLSSFFEHFSWTIIAIFALGVFRLTDIITHETVTEPLRMPFRDKKIQNGKETWQAATEGVRGFFATLVDCNACMGVWVAAFMFYLFLFFPTPTLLFMFVMTLTGLERFLSKIYNVLEKRG